MSMVLDLIICGVIVLSVFINWWRGFFRSLISFFGFFIALFCGWVFYPPVAELIEPKLEGYFEGTGAIETLSNSLRGFEIDARIAASVLAFGAVFLAVTLIILIVKIIMYFVLKLPVLKQMDKALGLMLGLVVGILFASVLSILAFTFSEVLIRSVESITAEMFEGSVVAKWLFEHNLFKFIMNLSH